MQLAGRLLTTPCAASHGFATTVEARCWHKRQPNGLCSTAAVRCAAAGSHRPLSKRNDKLLEEQNAVLTGVYMEIRFRIASVLIAYSRAGAVGAVTSLASQRACRSSQQIKQLEEKALINDNNANGRCPINKPPAPDEAIYTSELGVTGGAVLQPSQVVLQPHVHQFRSSMGSCERSFGFWPL